MAEILNKTQQERFEKCYAIYVKKVSVGDARKAWKQINPDEELTKTIFFAIQAQNIDRRSNPVDKQYLPAFGPWLRAGKWLDEIQSSAEARERNDLGKCKCGQPVSYAHEGLCSNCRHQASRRNHRKEIADILEKMGIYNPGETQAELNAKCKKYLTENRKDVIYNLSVKDD